MAQPKVFLTVARPSSTALVVVLLAVLLGCTCCVRGEEECYDGGQALNCSFQFYRNGRPYFTVCNFDTGGYLVGDFSWDKETHWFYEISYPPYNHGFLSSKRVCSTGDQEFCLRFRYFSNGTGLMGLYIRLQEEGSEDPTSLMTFYSGNDTNARVPIITNNTFQVTLLIHMSTMSSSSLPWQRVGFDNTEYVKAPCNFTPQTTQLSHALTTPREPSTNTNVKIKAAVANTSVKIKAAVTVFCVIIVVAFWIRIPL